MEFKHTLEVLYSQTDEINGLAEKLQSEKEIRKIELDLLLDKLRNVYDLVIDLQSIITPEDAGEKVEAETSDEGLADIPEKEHIEPVLKIVEPADEEVEKKPQAKVVSEQFSKTNRILNEQMTDQADKKDITSQYKSSPISNISSAIGVNERFELINELFKGDKDLFDKTIEELNRADSFEEALNYLKGKFEWDMDDVYVQRILDLIRRKLIVSRDE